MTTTPFTFYNPVSHRDPGPTLSVGRVLFPTVLHHKYRDHVQMVASWEWEFEEPDPGIHSFVEITRPRLLNLHRLLGNDALAFLPDTLVIAEDLEIAKEMCQGCPAQVSAYTTLHEALRGGCSAVVRACQEEILSYAKRMESKGTCGDNAIVDSATLLTRHDQENKDKALEMIPQPSVKCVLRDVRKMRRRLRISLIRRSSA